MPNNDLELIAGALHEVSRQQQAQAKVIQSQAELLATQGELLVASGRALALIAGKIKAPDAVPVPQSGIAPEPTAAAPKGKPGRPAGSTNKPKDTAVAAAQKQQEEIDYNTMREKFREVFEAKGHDVSVGILGEFRAQKLADIQMGDYQKFYARCVSLLSAVPVPAAADPLAGLL